MRRTKPQPKKEQTLVKLQGRLERASVSVITDYRGLTVAQVSQLRRQLDQLNVEYHVAKNTLIEIASRRAGLPDISVLLTGPSAVAFGYGDEPATAKALVTFAATSKVFKVKGGVLGRRVMDAEDVADLATLPSKNQLFSEVLGTLQSPASRVLGILSGPARSLVYLLQQRAEQLESQSGA